MKTKKAALLLLLAVSMLPLTACGITVGEGAGRITAAASETEPGSAEQTTSSAPEPTTDPDRVSFVAAGDNIIHESVFVDAKNRAATAASTGSYSGSYYFDRMYDGIREIISGADLAYVNQEGPVAGDMLGVQGYPTFNAPEEVGDALVGVGFDIVNIANNHMLDMDTSQRTGYKATLDYWRTKNVFQIGGYESESDYNTVRYIESKGIKIALLSYTYGTNGNKLSSSSPGLVVPYIDDATITRQVKQAKQQCDCVIVSMHWGTDTAGEQFNNYPTAEQKRLAQLLADLGVDAVVGMHPHVVQPTVWMNGKDGNRTLVIYSLGNLLSTMLHSYNNLGFIASFDIVRGEGGEISIENPVMNPVVCHYEADSSKTDSQGFATRSGLALYMLEDYTEELAARHGSQLYGSFTLSDMYGYVTDTQSDMLPDFLKQ